MQGECDIVELNGRRQTFVAGSVLRPNDGRVIKGGIGDKVCSKA